MSLATLQQADLRDSNLWGAIALTIAQLRVAATLDGTTLPDGMQLPASEAPWGLEPDWRTPFEEWCKTVEHEEHLAVRYIIPEPVEDDE